MLGGLREINYFCWGLKEIEVKREQKMIQPISDKEVVMNENDTLHPYIGDGKNIYDHLCLRRKNIYFCTFLKVVYFSRRV